MEASVQAQEEAKEAELSRKELGLEGGVDSLKALIQVKAASGPARVLCVLFGMSFGVGLSLFFF